MLPTFRYALASGLLLAAAACADPAQPDVGAQPDAGVADTGTPPDATTQPDASTPDSGTPEAGVLSYKVRGSNLAPAVEQASSARFRVRGRAAAVDPAAASNPTHTVRGGIVAGGSSENQ